MNHESSIPINLNDSQQLNKLDNTSIMGSGALRNTLLTASEVNAITAASTQAHAGGVLPPASTLITSDLIKDINNHLNISNHSSNININPQQSSSSSNSTMLTGTLNNSNSKHIREHINSSNAMDINSPPSSVKISNGHANNSSNNLAGLYLNKNQKTLDSNLNKLNQSGGGGAGDVGSGFNFVSNNSTINKTLVGGATTSKSNLNTNNTEGIYIISLLIYNYFYVFTIFVNKLKIKSSLELKDEKAHSLFINHEKT